MALSARSQPGAARESLHLLADAYVDFALANPELFSLILGPCPKGVRVDPLPGEHASAALFEAISVLPGALDGLAVSQVFWALTHGFATLLAAGQFRMGGEPRGALHLAVDLLVESISRGRA